MKITVPAVVRERVGFYAQYVGRDVYYDAPDRENVYGVIERKVPVYERRLTTRVVFNRDLRIAYRLGLVSILAVSAVVLPVLFTGATLVVFARSLWAGVETFAQRMDLFLRDAVDAAGDIGTILRDFARDIVRP